MVPEFEGLSKAVGWVTYEGVVPLLKLVAEALKWRSTGWCRDRKEEILARDPTKLNEVEAHVKISQQRGGLKNGTRKFKEKKNTQN